MFARIFRVEEALGLRPEWPDSVMLSGVRVSDSEMSAQSKHPENASHAMLIQGILAHAADYQARRRDKPWERTSGMAL